MVKRYIKKFLLTFFDKDVEIRNVEKLNVGSYSESFKVTTLIDGEEKEFVVKIPSENAPPFIRPVDFLSDYLITIQASNMSKLSPRVLGCYYVDERGKGFCITKPDSFKLFQIQEFKWGYKYLDMLVSKSGRKVISPEDRNEIDKIVFLLGQIHKIVFRGNEERKKALYKRALLEVITHPKLALSLFSQGLENSKVFKPPFRYAYLMEMIKVAEYFGGFYKRLSLIHGDFWSGNILFTRENEVIAVDFSNHCYGEPGIDVGNFFIELLWQSIIQKNSLYQKLADYFLDKYIEYTGDRFIERSAVTYIGFAGAICLVERFFPEVPNKKRTKFVNYILNCLKMKKLIRKYEF